MTHYYKLTLTNYLIFTKKENLLTIVACLKSHKIPYGQCDTDKMVFWNQ